MLKEGINWVETLAQIAEDKHLSALGAYIRKFDTMTVEYPSVYHYTPTEQVEEIASMVPVPAEYEVPKVDTSVGMPVDYSNLSSNFAKPKYNITKLPEATCDGCQ
jgi:hypothetical protein